MIADQGKKNNVALGIAPGPVNAKGVYGEAEYTGHYGTSSTKMLGDYSVPDNWPQKAHRPEPGGVPGPPVRYEKPMNPDDAAAGYGYQAAIASEPETFFYHSDHLGSTSYVTDRDGRATQFVVYMPYGESLVDEHAVSFESPFKFNGKEMDNETGLYYYGARYYEPGLCLWYGVDALAEKYPSLGGYVYCAGNPVRLVDVDGRKIYFARGCSEQFIKAYNDAVKTLKNKGVDRGLLEMIKSDEVYYIAETTENNSNFIIPDKTIYWNPNIEVECKDGYTISAVEILNHEGGHGAEYDKTLKKANEAYYEELEKSKDVDKAKAVYMSVWTPYLKSLKINKDNSYGSKEEERNITDIEQYTAEKLGRLKEGEVTRTSHGGGVVNKTNQASE